MHVRPSHVRQVGARESGAEVDAKKYGAELGAKIQGAELMPRPRHASSHVNDTQKMILDLGARAIDAEICKLGAKVRVYFLKGYHHDVFVKIFRKKAKRHKIRRLPHVSKIFRCRRVSFTRHDIAKVFINLFSFKYNIFKPEMVIKPMNLIVDIYFCQNIYY